MRFKIGLILITLMSNFSSFTQCGFNNTYYETVAAPTDLGTSVTTLLYGVNLPLLLVWYQATFMK